MSSDRKRFIVQRQNEISRGGVRYELLDERTNFKNTDLWHSILHLIGVQTFATKKKQEKH